MSGGKKVLVSGASSGIGEATARRFAAEGWGVCLTARREEKLRAVAASLDPGDHLVCPGDYSDPGAITRIEQSIRERWGRLDALVNCAGMFLPVDPILSSIDEWRKPFELMVNGRSA